MILTANLSQLDPATREAIVRHLQHEDAAQLALERVEQARLAKFHEYMMRPGANPHGHAALGRRHSCVHVGLQHRLAAQYGHDTAWRDPDFFQWLLKQDPSFRVPDVREKISTGWTPATKTLKR